MNIYRVCEKDYEVTSKKPGFQLASPSNDGRDRVLFHFFGNAPLITATGTRFCGSVRCSVNMAACLLASSLLG